MLLPSGGVNGKSGGPARLAFAKWRCATNICGTLRAPPEHSAALGNPASIALAAPDINYYRSRLAPTPRLNFSGLRATRQSGYLPRKLIDPELRRIRLISTDIGSHFRSQALTSYQAHLSVLIPPNCQNRTDPGRNPLRGSGQFFSA